MFEDINLGDELRENRNSAAIQSAQHFVNEMFEALGNEIYREKTIAKAIKAENGPLEKFRWNELTAAEVFSLNEIRNLCLTYRLRFLPGNHFKSEIPTDAALKVKQIERKLGREVHNFYIAAPTKMFRLENCEDDPLLFIQLSDRYFYLVYQWGKDMIWYKPITALPLRNHYTLATTLAIVSIILAFCIPINKLFSLGDTSELLARASFSFWIFLSLSGLVTCIGLRYFKNVSCMEWNSPFSKFGS